MHLAIDIGKALQIAVVSHLETFSELTAIVPVSRMYGMQPPANPVYPFIRYGFPIVGGFEATCWEGSTTRITLHAFAETTTGGPGEFIVSDIASLIVKAMNFAAYRAALVRSGVSPLEIHRMSLYEIASMNAALRKMDKPSDEAMSDDEFDALIDKVRAMNLPDVRI